MGHAVGTDTLYCLVQLSSTRVHSHVLIGARPHTQTDIATWIKMENAYNRMSEEKKERRANNNSLATKTDKLWTYEYVWALWAAATQLPLLWARIHFLINSLKSKVWSHTFRHSYRVSQYRLDCPSPGFDFWPREIQSLKQFLLFFETLSDGPYCLRRAVREFKRTMRRCKWNDRYFLWSQRNTVNSISFA